MLTLHRGVDEKIYIDDQIIVTVISVRGKRVKIGVQAPPNVVILREELYHAQKKGEKK